jgi:hypothetical protein
VVVELIELIPKALDWISASIPDALGFAGNVLTFVQSALHGLSHGYADHVDVFLVKKQ